MPGDKHVRYTSSTKGPSSHRSRDSGIGSSHSSQGASLGTAEAYDAEDQRRSPRALQNALNAANDRINQLEEANERFNKLLKEKSRDRRSLEGEREDLLAENSLLKQDVDKLKKDNERLRRERDEARSQNSRSTATSSAPRVYSTVPLPTTSGGERKARRRSVNEPRAGYTVPRDEGSYTHAPRTPTTAAFAPNVNSSYMVPASTVQYSTLPRTPADRGYHFQHGLDM